MLDLSDAFATFPVLETERLILRAMTPEDAEDMFPIYSDPEVMRFWGMEPFSELDHVRLRIEHSAKLFRERTGIRWAITRKGEGRVVGTCGHRRIIHEHYRSEVGYELARVASIDLGGGQLVITGIQGRANVVRTRDGVKADTRGTKFLTATVNGEEYSFPELDGLSIPGLVKIETGVVTKHKSGIEVVAVRLTLLDGSGAVIDLGHARLSIVGSGLR